MKLPPKSLPGRIIHEAPPGPGMTHEEFREAMNTMAKDAACWRWVRRNLMAVVLDWPIETMTGGDFQARVLRAMRES